MGLLEKFRRKVKSEPKTLEELIAAGIVDPALLQRSYIPQSGVSVKHYWRSPVGLELVDWIYYPSWRWYRADKLARYYGHEGLLGFRDIPTGVREPLIDLGAGVPEEDYNAARGFLIDQGIANAPTAANAAN